MALVESGKYLKVLDINSTVTHFEPVMELQSSSSRYVVLLYIPIDVKID